ncbi:dTDP-4-dehydrorhamnose reductase [Tranquillimonas rosea]|uniref:dTDP-4-dehydrorhamnose reductase n=1 Tax=Tranquillimonas rosea TaxID=641238 RepID=A0A1H9WZ34_9RHOB|nr:dTDP-4-dehydrorhamnose reductase [Tranquillimonas rosea]SES39089.1 dTDP-4-dehydrorhamnose reductase [Tranquillimonas rosea]
MKSLVLGHDGQLATALRRLGGDTVIALDRGAADLSDPEACAALVRDTRADAVINAAAWTDVDGAEADEAAARVVNAEAPAAMARAAAERDLPFLQVSTEYVFDGSGTAPWRPDDTPAPLNAYGRTKLAGEEGVRAAGGRHGILRTSWVISGTGRNFLTTMLHMGATHAGLRVVDDQVGGPTPAGGLATALLTLARALADGHDSGTWHYAGTPDVSWAQLAHAIFGVSGQGVRVQPIPTEEQPRPAPRPLNSRLDCGTLERDLGIARPDWQAALPDLVRGGDGA